MDGAGEDFCNGGMIAMLKYSNHFYSHPVRVSKIVKKVAWKSRFALPLGGAPRSERRSHILGLGRKPIMHLRFKNVET